jgi:S-formylglutathione hydrolase FrmB
LSLTGPWFLLFVVASAVLAFGAAVVGLPRVSAQRPSAILGRIGILVSVNIMVILTAAVGLNDQFGFFADWTDLHGALFGGTVVSSAMAGGGAATAANVPLAPATAAAVPSGVAAPALPALPPGAGVADRVLRFTVTGAGSGLTGEVLVTLPEGYTDPANQARLYPVLETFPGYPGDPSQWNDSLNLGAALDNAVAAHTAAPMITISPITEFPAGVDTECVDGPGAAPKVETWLTEDVPHWVRQHLRVGTDRTSWATIGLSAGAWCAAMATMLHPEQYAAGIVMGGYFAPEFSANYEPFTTTSTEGLRYDLIHLATLNPPPVALWIETSHSDSVSYPSSARMLASARPPLSIQALVLSHAGHRFGVWIGELPQALSWLGKNIAGFAP